MKVDLFSKGTVMVVIYSKYYTTFIFIYTEFSADVILFEGTGQLQTCLVFCLLSVKVLG